MLFGTVTLTAASIPSTVSYPSAKTAEEVEIQGVKAPPEVVKPLPPTIPSTSSVKALVEAEFGSDSIMVRVASCESKFRQFDADGTVLRGVANPQDRGVFQVNEHYHLEASKAMGLDIYTVKGNIAYARYLYDSQGTTPWNWSKPCWG